MWGSLPLRFKKCGDFNVIWALGIKNHLRVRMHTPGIENDDICILFVVFIHIASQCNHN